ncbi:MAG: fibrobacter succinogenes major paralogous domain-containing protein [Candidatus Kariarchaeaceae archaeon]|jgi:uncharacterized protein (TIGR02145 family)
MKKLLLIIAILATSVVAYTQAPQAFNYQAILRDSDGVAKSNETVAIQVSVIHGHTDGPPVYLEIHNTVTSDIGLVNLVIGEGVSSDDLSIVDWSNGPYYLDITVNGDAIGLSPLLSVPYALHANVSDSVTSPIPEIDPVYSISAASEISTGDIIIWNNKLDSYSEIQNLTDVLSEGNDGNGSQLKNIGNPTDENDAVTKAFATLRVSLTGDSLFMGADQYVIIPGISDANDTVNYVSDIEGNRYRVISLGSQTWMSENLRVTKYSDGTTIPLVEAPQGWTDLAYQSEAYCWYGNDPSNKALFGALYTWGAIMNGAESSELNPSGIQGVCPDNWHVPSDSEWKELEVFLGMPQSVADESLWRGTQEGGMLKTEGTSVWRAPNAAASNQSGFSALPSGYRYSNGDFEPINEYAVFWTTTDNTIDYAWTRGVRYDQSGIRRSNKVFGGMSVRCVKD